MRLTHAALLHHCCALCSRVGRVEVGARQGDGRLADVVLCADGLIIVDIEGIGAAKRASDGDPKRGNKPSMTSYTVTIGTHLTIRDLTRCMVAARASTERLVLLLLARTPTRAVEWDDRAMISFSAAI